MARTPRKSISFAIALATTAAFGPITVASAQDVDFEGETVEIMVNFAAGGGTDTAARLVAPYIAKHLPGNPNVIVTNRPGAGGNTGVGYLIDSVAPNGMTIGYFSGTLMFLAQADDSLPARAKDLHFVAGRSVNHVLVTSTDAGLTADTLPGYSDRFFLTANTPDNAQALRLRLLCSAIGADGFRLVSGYTTQGRMVSAVRAQEAEIAITNDSYFGSNREAITGDGVLVPLGQMGEFIDGKIVAQKGLEDIPVFDNIWRSAAPDSVDSAAYRGWETFHKAMAMQHAFALPIETPQSYQDAWETAILEAYTDPDYVAQLEKIGVPVPSAISAEAIEALLEENMQVFASEDVRSALDEAIAANME